MVDDCCILLLYKSNHSSYIQLPPENGQGTTPCDTPCDLTYIYTYIGVSSKQGHRVIGLCSNSRSCEVVNGFGRCFSRTNRANPTTGDALKNWVMSVSHGLARPGQNITAHLGVESLRFSLAEAPGKPTQEMVGHPWDPHPWDWKIYIHPTPPVVPSEKVGLGS